MLDLQAEQHDHGQSCPDLYEAVLQLKRRHDLHPCAVRPRDGLALRRDSERDLVQDLVKRFRDLPAEQQHRLPALLNSLAQLEVVIGDLEASQHDFQEVARLVADPIAQAEAHHNVYLAALERRNWTEALAALRRAIALDAETFEPFPLSSYEPERILGAGGFGTSFLCRERPHGRRVVVKALRADSLDRDCATLFREMEIVQDVDHPALVRIHDCAYAGSEESRPYLVLEYIEGQTLAEHVAQNGPLTPEDWLEVCWPLARCCKRSTDAVFCIAACAQEPCCCATPHPVPPPQGGREKDNPQPHPTPQGRRAFLLPPPPACRHILRRGRAGVGGRLPHAGASSCSIPGCP